MSGKIIETELLITGKDGTGGAFAGVIKHAQQLKATLAGLHAMRIGGADFAAAQAAIRGTTAALRTERIAAQEVTRAIAAGNAAIVERGGLISRMGARWQGVAQAGGMGWMIGGIASGRAMRAVAHDAGEFEHQRAMLATTTGMTPSEVTRAVDTAMALRVPLMSASDNLKAIGELRMVFGSTEHAIDNAAAIQRAAAVMKAVNPDKDASAESYDLARALELKGVSMDPAHFNRLTNMMVQAINASRGKVTGEGFFEFTQYARGAARYLSDDFYTRVAPSLIQEMRPTSAGRAIASLYQQVIGGKMSNRAAQEWVKLGLIDPHKVIFTKTGSVKGVKPGAFTDAAGFMADPHAWIQKYLKPALAKHGITGEAKVGEEIAHLFSNMYASQLAGILLTQDERLEKDIGLNKQAPGTDALEKMREADPWGVALPDLAKGINSLLSVLGSPLMERAGHVLGMMADGARSFASAYHALTKINPQAAQIISGAGVVGLGAIGLQGLRSMYGLVGGGVALKGSAVALTQSAAALDVAAARLGGAGLANGALRQSAGLAPVVGELAPVAGVAGGLFGWIPWIAAAISIATQHDIQTKTRDGKLWSDIIRDRLHPNEDFISAEGLKPLSRLSIMDALYTPHANDDAIRRVGNEPAAAELTGNAEIAAKITVEPSPDFITRIETMISNAIKGVHINGEGTTGSTGHSMPEAEPSSYRHW